MYLHVHSGGSLITRFLSLRQGHLKLMSVRVALYTLPSTYVRRSRSSKYDTVRACKLLRFATPTRCDTTLCNTRDRLGLARDRQRWSPFSSGYERLRTCVTDHLPPVAPPQERSLFERPVRCVTDSGKKTRSPVSQLHFVFSGSGWRLLQVRWCGFTVARVR